MHFGISVSVYLTHGNFDFCKCKYKIHMEQDNSTNLLKFCSRKKQI